MANLRLFVISGVGVVLFTYFMFSFNFFQSSPSSPFPQEEISKLNVKVEKLENWRKNLMGLVEDISESSEIQSINSSTNCIEVFAKFMQFLKSGEGKISYPIEITTTPTTPATQPTSPPPSPTPTSPPVKPHVRVAIGVLSHHTRRGHRDVIRETWTKLLEGTEREKDFVYRFFIGYVEDEQQTKDVEEEAKQYGDIVFAPIKEHYRNITHKTLAIMDWGTTYYDADYVMKMDDDSFVDLSKLLDDLEKRPREKLYLGMDIGGYSPIRDPGSPWYMPWDEYPNSHGPHLIVGCGYVISKDGAKYMADRSKDGKTKVLGLEDVNTAVLLADAQIYATNHVGFHNTNRCQNGVTILSHYVPLERMRKYYENLKEGKPMCDGTRKRSIDNQNDYSGSCLHMG